MPPSRSLHGRSPPSAFGKTSGVRSSGATDESAIPALPRGFTPADTGNDPSEELVCFCSSSIRSRSYWPLHLPLSSRGTVRAFRSILPPYFALCGLLYRDQVTFRFPQSLPKPTDIDTGLPG